MTLSPNWEKVTREKDIFLVRTEVEGSVIPIYLNAVQYVDVDTNEVFLSTTTLTTDDGFLQRNLYGLGLGSECRPENLGHTFKQVNIDKLVEQGKTK